LDNNPRPNVDTHRDGKTGRHAIQIVGIVTHFRNFGDDRAICPLNAEYFCQLL
jgi:hypothetical protein